MTKVIRVLAGALLVSAIVPGPVLAGVPSPANWITPPCIPLVGSTGGVPASAFGAFTVTIRDLANNPQPNASVVIDFSNCLDIEICADQLDPNVQVNCAAKTVRKLTDLNGQVTFTILGGSNGYRGSGPSTLLGGGRIYANGVLGANPTVSAFDLDGAAGVGANDLSTWLGDFGSSQQFGRSDYDCSNNLGANDFSLLLTAFGSTTMTTSCATSCP